MSSTNAYIKAVNVASERNPDLRRDLATLAAWLPFALAQCSVGPEQMGSDKKEKGGPGRLAAIFTRYGTRLLDCDNLAGGFKALVDACRYEKIIPEDDPEAIDLIFRQRKVKRPQIGTEILIQRF